MLHVWDTYVWYLLVICCMLYIRGIYIYPKILYWQGLHTWSIQDIEIVEEVLRLNMLLFMVND